MKVSIAKIVVIEDREALDTVGLTLELPNGMPFQVYNSMANGIEFVKKNFKGVLCEYASRHNEFSQKVLEL